MSKQDLAPQEANPVRHEGTRLVRPYGTQPIVRTIAERALGMDIRAVGTNVILAIASIKGFNQEDALIVDKFALDLGLLDYIKFYVKDIKVRVKPDKAGIREVLARPYIEPAQEEIYHAIGQNGLPRIGSVLQPEDVVISKLKYPFNPNSPFDMKNPEHLKSATKSMEKMKVGEYGVVHDVKVIKDGEELYVSVLIRDYRRPSLGDKIYITPSQKTTIGKIEQHHKMPFDPITGLTPQIVMNPHAIPSRMTMGPIYEMLQGTALVKTGRTYDATGFQDYDIQKFKDILVGDFPKETLELLKRNKAELDRYDPIVQLVPTNSVGTVMKGDMYELVNSKISERDILKRKVRTPEEEIKLNVLNSYLQDLKSAYDLPEAVTRDSRRILIRASLPDTVPQEILPFVQIEYNKIDNIKAHLNQLQQKAEYVSKTEDPNVDIKEISIKIEELLHRINMYTGLTRVDIWTPQLVYMVGEILEARDNLHDVVRGFEKTFQSGKKTMTMYSNGLNMETPMAIGPVRAKTVVHMAEDKIQGRAVGRVDEVTKQAPAGKTNNGAVKFGTMELNALVSYGAAHIAQERMCLLADAYPCVWCLDCGIIAERLSSEKKWKCPLCITGKNFGVKTIPYVFKYLTQLLLSVGIFIQNKMSTEEEFPAKITEYKHQNRQQLSAQIDADEELFTPEPELPPPEIDYGDEDGYDE